jgi:hypothetical protein
MRSYKEYMEAVEVSKEKWGVEINGTVAEVIAELKKYPLDAYSIASVEMKKPSEPMFNRSRIEFK